MELDSAVIVVLGSLSDVSSRVAELQDRLKVWITPLMLRMALSWCCWSRYAWLAFTLSALASNSQIGEALALDWVHH